MRMLDDESGMSESGLNLTRTVRTSVREYEWYEWYEQYELSGVLFEPFTNCTFGNAHLLGNCDVG